jgi:WS/DGAT/MGAT family acyltransferase
VDRQPRLAAFDAVMYGIEGDPILRSVIIALLVLDREPDRELAIDRIERMTLAVPKFRQRVSGSSWSPTPPRWETDPNFDLSYHLRWHRAPVEDGTLRPALTTARRMAEQDFDRARPLWEVTLVSGLPDGRAAVVLKIHHAITDGMGALQLAAALLDLERSPDPVATAKPKAPKAGQLDPLSRAFQGIQYESSSLVRGVTAVATATPGLAYRAIRHPQASAGEALGFAGSATRVLAPASTPLSPIMTGRSLSSHLDYVEVPFADLRAAAKSQGATVNDAYLTIVMGALGRYHGEHGAVVDSLRVNMPINVRPAGDASAGGNAWVPARFPVPVGGADPADQMRRLGPLLRQAREEPALALSQPVYQVLARLPRPVATALAGGLMKGTDFAATNVPGPPIPVYFAGAQVERLMPFAPKGGAAVNFALFTYDGVAQIAVNLDLAAIPDPEVFMGCLRAACDDVLALGRMPAAPKPKARKAPVRRD